MHCMNNVFISTPDGRIRGRAVNYNGSANDAAVLGRSGLSNDIMGLSHPFALAGDKGFPQLRKSERELKIIRLPKEREHMVEHIMKLNFDADYLRDLTAFRQSVEWANGTIKKISSPNKTTYS